MTPNSLGVGENPGEERWHLLGADDNLEWIVLFYATTQVKLSAVSAEGRSHWQASRLRWVWHAKPAFRIEDACCQEEIGDV